jgi:hypothetical protein
MSELVGVKVKVRLSQQCRCGETLLVVGPKNGPHIAELTCSSCSRHVKWLAKRDAAAVCEAIRKHGRDGVTDLCKSTSSRDCRTYQKLGGHQ